MDVARGEHRPVTIGELFPRRTFRQISLAFSENVYYPRHSLEKLLSG